KGVISSLWNVNDKSAADLMVNYYKNLQFTGSTAGVLTKTKLAWLNQKHKNQMVLLPYYWDSLIYTGEDFSVALSKPNHIMIYALVSILILCIVGIYFYRYRKLNIAPASR